MSKNLLKEVYKMFIGVFSMSALMVIVFAILGYFDISVILGALLGSTGCVLNYLFLAYSVERVVEKDKAQVKGYMSMSYTFRMIFIAGVIVLAVKLPYVNYIAAAIPFFFTRIVITILNVKLKKKPEASAEGGDDI